MVDASFRKYDGEYEPSTSDYLIYDECNFHIAESMLKIMHTSPGPERTPCAHMLGGHCVPATEDMIARSRWYGRNYFVYTPMCCTLCTHTGLFALHVCNVHVFVNANDHVHFRALPQFSLEVHVLSFISQICIALVFNIRYG